MNYSKKLKDMRLYNGLTFKTLLLGKNYDLDIRGDNLISEYDGTITYKDHSNKKKPEDIGEYGISVWNIGLANQLGVDIIGDTLPSNEIIDIYREFEYALDNKTIDLSELMPSKLVFVHNLILKPQYRNKGVVNEFVEFVYRNFYSDIENMVLFLVKPIQTNPLELFYFLENEKKGNNQYQIKKLLEYDDIEMIEYKLFNTARKSGLKRIDDETYLFELIGDEVFERIKKKQESIKKIIDNE